MILQSFSIEMIKAQILMNKSVYLGLSVLDLNKIVFYECWFDYVKPKSFIVHVKKDKRHCRRY